MRILLYVSGRDAGAWREAFARALPEADVLPWPVPAGARFDYAVVTSKANTDITQAFRFVL